MIAQALAASEPGNVIDWFRDSSQRTIEGPIPQQMWTTIWHSVTGLLIAAALTIPTALYLAHRRKAQLVSNWVAGVGRAVPTVTVVALLAIVSLRQGFGFEPWPILIALVLLALPPLYTNTYAAVRAVDPDTVSAARAMGFTERAIMIRVELPLALPVMLAGVRTALVQLLATEPLGAFFGGSGLGIYLYIGLENRTTKIYEVQAGAILVAAVAIGADLLLAGGLRLAGLGQRRHPAQDAPAEVPEPGPDQKLAVT